MQRMPQDQDSADGWPQDMIHDAMVEVGDDDFTKFLDLDSGFEQYQQLSNNHGRSGLDTPMGRLAFGSSVMQHLSGHDPDAIENIDISMLEQSHMQSAFVDMGPDVQLPQQQQQPPSRQQFQPYQMYQQMNPTQRYQVPPTPVSAEMHAAKYAGQILFDRNQASFTPLVSPAQTPLETAYCMPDYVTDDLFSPLTSPAIEDHQAFSSTNATASPLDLNADTLQASGLPARSGRRKGTQASQRPSTRSVRQSPAMKPQTKRRQFSLNSLPVVKIQTMLENQNPDSLQPSSARATTFASSEDSVSPEPLSESLMRPPPVPSSLTRSPAQALQPQSKDDNLPATPAMIMRMPGKQSSQSDPAGAPLFTADVMEDIALPDAAAGVQPRTLPNSGTLVHSPDAESTPTIAAKTPKVSANSTPRSSVMKATNHVGELVDKVKRSDPRSAGRANKKRQSISSAAISPALRPKISPSISPLVPATGTGMPGFSAETNALFLASKSNYQNILDGTHLPGVSYPETLAENLSSKRTSHKIAEQGRRNRINTALKEIESLLPPSIILSSAGRSRSATSTSKDNDEGSPDKASGSNAAQGASKASTVEMAITYIKSLQAELKETREKLVAAEKMIADGHSSSSQASEAGTG